MFKDKEVETKVKYKLDIFDDTELSEDDLNKVTEILISNKNLRGEVINTDLSELVKLRKLQSLDLKGFELSEEVLRVIHGLPELVALSLYDCQAKESVAINIERLKSLILDHCQNMNFSEIHLPETLLIVDGGVVDVSKFQHHQHLKDLGIKSSEIIHANSLEEITSLKNLNVDGSTLDDDNIVNKLRAKKVVVSNEFEYHPLK